MSLLIRPIPPRKLGPGRYQGVADPDMPVPMRSKFANRFYEPILLLDSLGTAWRGNQTLRVADIAFDVTQSSERAFHSFVNKLGQICDRECGGKTVTAFVVLEYPDHIQYRFASNQQERNDLVVAEKFINRILRTLGRATDDQLRETASPILRYVLSFTRPRVGAYIKSLKDNTAACISTCTVEGTEEAKSIVEKLVELRELLSFSNNPGLDNDAFSTHCERLIDAIHQIKQSGVDNLIRIRTKEGKIDESKFWCELRHAAGRLLSYQDAIKVLISTRKDWPVLFETFEVCSIASSVPTPFPLLKNPGGGALTMGDIIGRMTSDQEAMMRHRALAQELERFGVNKDIQEQFRLKKIRPIVHAEVLLLDSLEADGGTRPSRFFNGYRYIGCSKPTCRLCDYYFSSHPSSVQVRPTHRNLYPSWRLPDVYADQGRKAEKKRENLMNKILLKIREDAFRTLKEKVIERKAHDSNTDPTYLIESIHNHELDDSDDQVGGSKNFNIDDSGDEGILGSEPGDSIDVDNLVGSSWNFDIDDSGDEGILESSPGDLLDVDDLVGGFKNFDIDDSGDEGILESSPGDSLAVDDFSQAENDDDGEDGGVKL